MHTVGSSAAGGGLGAGSAGGTSSGLSHASKLAALRVARAKAKSNGGAGGGGQGDGSNDASGSSSAAASVVPGGSVSKRFHIPFHLRPQDKPTALSSLAFKKLIHDEYCTKYLESLGVTPTRTTLEMARRELPIEELRVAAAWKSDTVTIMPLERATVMANARARKQRSKAKFLAQARADAERNEQQQQQLKAKEDSAAAAKDGTPRGRSRTRGGCDDATAANSTSPVSARKRSRSASRGGARSRSRSRSRRSGAHGSTLVAAAVGPTSARAVRTPRSGVGAPSSDLASGSGVAGAGLDEVISSVLTRQEHVFETLRRDMDHKMRMGDRDDEIDAFWRAAQAPQGALSASVAAAAARQGKSSGGGYLREESKDNAGAAASAASLAASSSSAAAAAAPSPAPLLHVFTLYHFMHAHSFTIMTRRGAIMALEESSIAGENVLKRRDQRSAGSGNSSGRAKTPADADAAASSASSGQGRKREPKIIMYWIPKSGEEGDPAAAAAASTATAAPAFASIFSSQPAPFSASLGSFGPSSRSFAALSQLFFHPFVSSVSSSGGVGASPSIESLLSTFFTLVPAYRKGIEQNFNQLEGGYGLAGGGGGATATMANGGEQLRALSASGGAISAGGTSEEARAWEAFHANFSPTSTSDGRPVTLSIGAAAALALSASEANTSGVGTTMLFSGSAAAERPPLGSSAAIAPSKLQAFYSPSDFARLLREARAMLTSSHVCELVGLLCHYLYHTLFAPQLSLMRQYTTLTLDRLRAAGIDPSVPGALAGTGLEAPVVSPPVMGPGDIGSIGLTLSGLFVEVDHSLRKLSHYSLFFKPLFLDALCTTVLHLLHNSFPLWYASSYGYASDQAALDAIDRIFDVHQLAAIPGHPTRANLVGAPSAAATASGGAHNVSAALRHSDFADPSAASAASAPSSATGSSLTARHSLFFHTSALVRGAFPQPLSEGARQVRKEETARRWNERLHAQQEALARRNAERRQQKERERSAMAQQMQLAAAREKEQREEHKEADAPSPRFLPIPPASAPPPASTPRASHTTRNIESRIGGSLGDTNRFSISSRLARIHAADAAAASHAATAAAATAVPNRALGRGGALTARQRPVTGNASAGSQTARPVSSHRAPSPASLLGEFTPASSSVSTRTALFQLGLRKIHHRAYERLEREKCLQD